MESNALRRAPPPQRDRAWALSVAATAFGLGWLVLILGVLVWEGLGGARRSKVFTEMTPPPGADGGLLNADHRQPDP